MQDTHDSSLYALKKIRCPFGEESVSQALREVEAYTLFAGHPNIIHSIDHSVVTDKSDASAKTVYVLLPYCQHGNLQDMINANLVNRSKIPQKRLMTLMLGTCKALKAMHQFQPKNTANGLNPLTAARRVKAEAATADTEAAQVAGKGKGKGKAKANGTESSPDEDGLEHDPLIDREGTWGPDGPSPDGPSPGEHYGAFAHRDIKPGMPAANSQCSSPHTPLH